jgi:L-ascorbate metabolism protein UlaG (beta-lactamase superfamily)
MNIRKVLKVSVEESPSKNEVLFVWFNSYAGVTLKTPSKTLVIDPVDVRPRDFKNVDAILITHEHYDHMDPSLISEVQKQTQCSVVADPTSVKKLRHLISSEKLVEVKPGSEVKFDKVSAKVESCNHPPAATSLSFIITSEDDVKVFHTADSLPFPEMATIGEREKLDLVFCTVGIAPGTSPETGFEIARLTRPKVAVPYHTGSSVDQKKFAELLRKDLPKMTCLIPERAKIYQVSKRK